MGIFPLFVQEGVIDAQIGTVEGAVELRDRSGIALVLLGIGDGTIVVDAFRGGEAIG